jgi:ribokinase
LGETGAYLKSEDYTGLIPGIKVTPVDTTAAGDVFNGALAVAISEGNDLKNAVIFANKAASISVTRMGAQASAPYRNEIK